MYWFFKPKKYDPSPHSRLVRALHYVFGCPIQKARPVRRRWGKSNLSFWLHCNCGECYEFGVENTRQEKIG